MIWRMLEDGGETDAGSIVKVADEGIGWRMWEGLMLGL
jgi:hypothetical protein